MMYVTKTTSLLLPIQTGAYVNYESGSPHQLVPPFSLCAFWHKFRIQYSRSTTMQSSPQSSFFGAAWHRCGDSSGPSKQVSSSSTSMRKSEKWNLILVSGYTKTLDFEISASSGPFSKYSRNMAVARLLQRASPTKLPLAVFCIWSTNARTWRECSIFLHGNWTLANDLAINRLTQPKHARRSAHNWAAVSNPKPWTLPSIYQQVGARAIILRESLQS